MKTIAKFLRKLAHFLESGEIGSICRDTAAIITLAVGIMVAAGFIGIFTASFMR